MNLKITPQFFNILAHSLPWVLFLFFVFTAYSDPELMRLYTAKDDDIPGGGLIENLTVIILIPGIIAGLWAFLSYRNNMLPHWTKYWLLIWVLACTYFAGEEASWGQWYFEWETPELFSEINDQNETNLHNTSTWFDQKPRSLVELWIFITGLALPIYLKLNNKHQLADWHYWINPIPNLISAAFIFTLIRLASFIDDQTIKNLLGSSEIRELFIAIFLSLFLLSYLVRLRKTKNRI